MVSLEQILLLQEKVESAVAKIAQLNAENAALRRKCVELTNALDAKTEQFSSFQSDQKKIEEGILKALSRLDVVENAVLSTPAAETIKTSDHEVRPGNPVAGTSNPSAESFSASNPVIQSNEIPSAPVSQPVSFDSMSSVETKIDGPDMFAEEPQVSDSSSSESQAGFSSSSASSDSSNQPFLEIF